MNYKLSSILNKPILYRLFSDIIGGSKLRKFFVEKHLRPKAGDVFLDIGCGTGNIIGYLPEVHYVGFDMNQSYIEFAKEKYGNRGSFYCNNVGDYLVKDHSKSDLVMAKGVLHHLKDEEVLQLLEIARKALKPAGRLVTLDGCYNEKQSWIARLLLSLDRGCYVRTREQYVSLAQRIFSNVEVSMYNNLLRFPYTHIIMECKT